MPTAVGKESNVQQKSAKKPAVVEHVSFQTLESLRLQHEALKEDFRKGQSLQSLNQQQFQVQKNSQPSNQRTIEDLSSGQNSANCGSPAALHSVSNSKKVVMDPQFDYNLQSLMKESMESVIQNEQSNNCELEKQSMNLKSISPQQSANQQSKQEESPYPRQSMNFKSKQGRKLLSFI